MLTLAEQISRRVGRMEALVSDLGQLKPDYEPTELETTRALEIYGALARVFDLELAAAPPAPPPAAKAKAGKK